MSTPIDPFKIDKFKNLKEDAATGLDMSPGNLNSAWAVQEIEALRSKNKELGEAIASQISQELIDKNEAMRERVAELEKIKNNWIEAGKLRGERADQEQSRAEAAEAREAELKIEKQSGWECLIVLAGALEAVRPFFEGEHSYDHPDCVQIRTALATTPAQAMERARAKTERLKALEDCATVLRYYARNEVGEVIRRALDNLDALNKEKEGKEDGNP